MMRKILPLLILILFSVTTLARVKCNDAPLGIWLIWDSDDWKKALYARYEDERILYKEYEKFNDLNANFMIDWVGQLPILSRDYKNGSLNLQVFSTQGEMTDSLTALPKGHYPGQHYDQPYTLRHLFKVYAKNDESLDSAKFTIKDIVNNMKINHRKDDLIYGYPLFGEIFGIKGDEQNKRFEEMANYSINLLREFDKKRPISFDHSYYHIFKSNSKRQSYSADTSFAGDVLSGKRMPGWNIWMDFNYNLRPPDFFDQENEYYFYDESEVAIHPVEKSYDSGFYLRREWMNNTIVHRELSLRLEDYCYAMDQNKDFEGPGPEWWYIFQSQREWRKGDDDFWLLYRRPTKYELRALPFTALASGARGISTYCYKTTNKRKIQYSKWAEAPDGLIGGRIENRQSRKSLKTREGIPARYDIQRLPVSSQFENSDDIPDEEAYIPGEYFPYDEVADLYSDLQDLLPVIRNLRWWWTVDGSDSSFYDYCSNDYDIYHGSLNDQMKFIRKNRPEYGHYTQLSQKFRLVSINSEVEQNLFLKDGNPSNRLYSSIVVGLFDDKEDEDSEYYLLVNRHTSRAVVGPKPFIIDADSQDFEINFNVDSDDYKLEQVWSAVNSNSTLLFKPQFDKNILRQKVRLDPGDALLIKLSRNN